MSARRDPTREEELRDNATKALRELDEYYHDVHLRGPMKLTGKALSLLAFIKGRRRPAPGRDAAPPTFPGED